jgi:hypothetical protein
MNQLQQDQLDDNERGSVLVGTLDVSSTDSSRSCLDNVKSHPTKRMAFLF